jgi:putative membrane protein
MLQARGTPLAFSVDLKEINMKNGLRILRLAAIVTVVGGSVAVAQTGGGSTGAAGGPASGSSGVGMSGAPGASGTAPATGGAGPAARKSALSSADESFVSQAAQNGFAEIETGKLAMEKASDAKVKEFAKHMIDDHTQANEELKTLTTSKGVEIPDDPSLLQRGKAMLMLKTASGATFDRRYAESMGVQAHEDNIKLFEKAAGSAEDADVKAYAQKSLPKLQAHLKMAQELVNGLPKD